MDKMFDAFCYQGSYSLKELILLGLLLSFGNFTDKARLMFEVFDLECCGYLSKDDIENLVDSLIDISINKIPLMLKNKNYKMTRYLNILQNNKAKAKYQILSYFNYNKSVQISSLEFMEQFYHKTSTRLLNSFGIRKFIYLSD